MKCHNSWTGTTDPTTTTIEFKPAPLKWVAILGISLSFTAGGTFIVREGHITNLFMGFVTTIFGLVGTVVSVVALFSKRMVLRLTVDGFGFGTLKKRYFYQWSDILIFGVGSIGKKRVCFGLRDGAPIEENVRKINRRAIGFDRFLPDTYGKNPMELAKLMEEWRHRYSGSAFKKSLFPQNL